MIPVRKIGWGVEENLLWQISKQLENLTGTIYEAGSNLPTSDINLKLQTVTSISELQNYTNSNFAYFDGSVWDKKSGNVTSNGGSFAGTLIRVSSSVYWERKFGKDVNLDWFGINGNNATDNTALLNIASQAVAVHVGNSTTLNYNLVLPSGNFVVNGTVYIRKGQHLKGMGNGATRIIIPNETNKNTFVCGKGLISGSEVVDAGGLPIQISDIGFEGGTGTALCVDNLQGFSISNCFFSGCGKALEIKNGSADGVINNCIFDINLNSILINSSQNLLFSNIVEYNSNYGITFQNTSNDIQFVNYHSEYIKYAGVLLGDGSSNTNISFSNVNFVLNAQYSTFSGFVYDRSDYSDIIISNGKFRNMKSYAIRVETPTTHFISLNDCVFDGNKTNLGYAQSTTSAGIEVLNASVKMSNCDFKNIVGYALNISSSTFQSLIWDGGTLKNLTATYSINITSTGTGKIELKNINGGDNLLFNAQEYVSIKMQNLNNWLKKIDDGSNIYWLIPFQFATLYQVSIKANIASGGNANYRKNVSYFVSVQNGYNGTIASTFLENQLVFKNSVTNFINDILMNFKLNSTSGSTTVSIVNSGYICVYIPNTYTNIGFDCQQIL